MPVESIVAVKLWGSTEALTGRGLDRAVGTVAEGDVTAVPSRGGFALRISALLHFRRKSSACHKAGSTPALGRLREFIPKRDCPRRCCSSASRGVRRDHRRACASAGASCQLQPANSCRPQGYVPEGAHVGKARRGADCRASICQFFLPIKCARIILHFGL